MSSISILVYSAWCCIKHHCLAVSLLFCLSLHVFGLSCVKKPEALVLHEARVLHERLLLAWERGADR